ncbi:DNA polymerase III epsilon subunit-like 3'-5' exonuclease [Thermanaerovibrio velox DSM 12556]|uniref:DNA polymerase III epsilon subunit-like 3'-5' exonuclease n=1 Tax=Thermanaerovibrio velox DSM 12556 TaxID=926567 RepID=H0URE7_9BACT|nr:exonuclease domain-containing protein [Thermanaerovibrio velox]EHM10916.1 DNA polymerase III epsilon subunit-like 3'-5' exonuclease [Thermanaerovibrio velox DSM 12556]
MRFGIPDFAALDFETANRFHESPCALGVVVVRSFEIVEEASFHILPHRDFRFFEPMNVRVHGITLEALEGAQEFPDVFEDFFAMVKGLPLVAHNARFDGEVMLRTMGLYRMDPADLRFFCSLRLARRVFRFKRCGLSSMAEYLGIPFYHHDPLEDARLAAKVAVAAMMEADNLDDLPPWEEQGFPDYRQVLSQVQDRINQVRSFRKGKRRSACGAPPEMLELDVESRSGFFRSSSSNQIYFTTLHSCTCPYHQSTYRECKHMRALREILLPDLPDSHCSPEFLEGS